MSDSSLDRQRWIVVIGGIICQFCAGMLYSWSIYVNPLLDKYPAWTRTSVSFTFSITTLLIPILMIPAGKRMDKEGPRKVAMMGACFLTAGLLISSVAKSIPLLYIGYGVLNGFGVGHIYGVPIATCARWFPDKKGFISGMSVAGFGLGSIIFSPLGRSLIDKFGDPQPVFRVQALITIIGMIIGASLLKPAPEGYKPAGWNPPATAAGSTGNHEYTSGEMIKTGPYWILLITYMIANIAGLTIIGHASPIAQEVAKLTPADAALVVSFLAIANLGGRFAGGLGADKIGAKNVITIIFIVSTILLLLMNTFTNKGLITLGICGIGACFGATMGTYPSIIADYFGLKYYSTNYAFLHLGYGFGGIIGNVMAAASISKAAATPGMGTYTLCFIIMGIATIIGIVMSRTTKAPVYKGTEA